MGIPCLFAAPVWFPGPGPSPDGSGGGRARFNGSLAALRRWAPGSGLFWGFKHVDEEEGCVLLAAAAAFPPGLLAVEAGEPTIKAIEASSLLNTGVSTSPTAGSGAPEPSNFRAASPPCLPVRKFGADAEPPSEDLRGAGGAPLDAPDLFRAEEGVGDPNPSFLPPPFEAAAGALFLFEPPPPPPAPAGFLGCFPPDPPAPVSAPLAVDAVAFFLSPS